LLAWPREVSVHPAAVFAAKWTERAQLWTGTAPGGTL